MQAINRISMNECKIKQNKKELEIKGDYKQ